MSAGRAVRVRVRRLSHAESLPLPGAASAGSAGCDLHAALGADLELAPGARALVPTGLVIELPPGYEAQVRPRSGWALRHGVTLVNSPGTIDADYRGEIQVLLINLGDQPVTVRRGDRIAQLVVAPVLAVEWQEAESLAASTRDSGGFGSTGR